MDKPSPSPANEIHRNRNRSAMVFADPINLVTYSIWENQPERIVSFTPPRRGASSRGKLGSTDSNPFLYIYCTIRTYGCHWEDLASISHSGKLLYKARHYIELYENHVMLLCSGEKKWIFWNHLDFCIIADNILFFLIVDKRADVFLAFSTVMHLNNTFSRVCWKLFA